MKQSKVNGLVPELSEATGEHILESTSTLSYYNISALILPLLLAVELPRWQVTNRSSFEKEITPKVRNNEFVSS